MLRPKTTLEGGAEKRPGLRQAGGGQNQQRQASILKTEPPFWKFSAPSFRIVLQSYGPITGAFSETFLYWKKKRLNKMDASFAVTRKLVKKERQLRLELPCSLGAEQSDSFL